MKRVVYIWDYDKKNIKKIYVEEDDDRTLSRKSSKKDKKFLGYFIEMVKKKIRRLYG